MAEYEEQRTCEAEDVTIYAMTTLAVKSLKQAKVELDEDARDDTPRHLLSARQHVRDAVYGLNSVEMSRCVFVGPVMVRYWQGQTFWDCPACGTQHVDDWDPDEGDPDLDRKYRLENG